MERLLGALAENRFSDAVTQLHPDAVARIARQETDSLTRDFDGTPSDDFWDGRRANLRDAWAIGHPSELSSFSPGEVVVRYLAANQALQRESSAQVPWSNRDWRVMAAVRQNTYVCQVVFQARPYREAWAWWLGPDPWPVHIVRVVLSEGRWRVDPERGFFREFDNERRSVCADPIGTALSGVVARIWLEIRAARCVGDAVGADARAAQFLALESEACLVEASFEETFLDPDAAAATIGRASRDIEDGTLEMLLGNPGSISPVHDDATGEELVAAVAAYAARFLALLLLGVSVPRRHYDAHPRLVHIILDHLRSAMDRFVIDEDLGAPGIERLERWLLVMMGGSLIERAACRLLVPEIGELLRRHPGWVPREPNE